EARMDGRPRGVTMDRQSKNPWKTAENPRFSREKRAEGAGFEPANASRRLRFSRPMQSTTLPPLRNSRFILMEKLLPGGCDPPEATHLARVPEAAPRLSLAERLVPGKPRTGPGVGHCATLQGGG